MAQPQPKSLPWTSLQRPAVAADPAAAGRPLVAANDYDATTLDA
jgi:hypothetical protein